MSTRSQCLVRGPKSQSGSEILRPTKVVAKAQNIRLPSAIYGVSPMLPVKKTHAIANLHCTDYSGTPRIMECCPFLPDYHRARCNFAAQGDDCRPGRGEGVGANIMTFNNQICFWMIGVTGIFLIAYILAKLMAG